MGKNIEQQMRKDFGQRLKNARKMRGLSLSELASRLEGVVSSTAIDKYEKGLMYPQSSTMLIALAEALNISLGDLMRPIKYKIDTLGFSFRKKGKLGAKTIEQILQYINMQIEKYLEIQEITNAMQPYTEGRYPEAIKDESDARHAAMHLREAWGLGTSSIASPILLLEDHGVLIIEVEEDPTLFDGTSNTINGVPVIIVNSKNKDDNNPDEERRRLTTFHEFGHQYLTFDDSVSDKEKENLCNVFANEMLLPSEVMIRVLGDHRSTIYNKELKNLQQEYGISARALMMKARQLAIINENNYKWFCIKLNKDNEFKQYIDKNVTTSLHTNRFEQLVLKALAQEVITITKAAEYLGVGVAELDNKLNRA